MNVDSPEQAAFPRKRLNLDTALGVNASSESWQRALFDAVVETRRSKALQLICRARSIVDCRLAEIVFEDSQVIHPKCSIFGIRKFTSAFSWSVLVTNEENFYGIKPCRRAGSRVSGPDEIG